MAIQIDYTIKNLSHTEFVVLYDQLKQLEPFSSYRVMVLDNIPLRTPRANRYLWFIYKIMSEETGFTITEIHMLMKYMFNMEIYFTPFFAIEDAGSTTNLNRVKFAWFIKQVRQWANSWLKIDIPDPEELTEEQKIAIKINDKPKFIK